MLEGVPVPVFVLASLAVVAAGIGFGLKLARRAPAPPHPGTETLRDLLARLEAHPPDAPARPGAIVLLVDLQTLYGPHRRPHTRLPVSELKRLVARGRPLNQARGYFATGDLDEATVARDALVAAGYEPRVYRPLDPAGACESAHDHRVRLTLDALGAARTVETLILATHDVALADLVEALRDRGKRVEVAGVPGAVPERLAEAADALHALPPATVARNP